MEVEKEELNVVRAVDVLEASVSTLYHRVEELSVVLGPFLSEPEQLTDKRCRERGKSTLAEGILSISDAVDGRVDAINDLITRLK